MDGARKTAILLLSLDQPLAAEVLGKLPREQVEQVTLAIANADNVSRDEQELILSQFKLAFQSRPLMHPAGPQSARDLLERALDQNDVEPMQQRINDQVHAGPFAFLHHRHAEDIGRLIEFEHPQTIAVISAQLPPDLAALVLARFPADVQADVLRRLAQLGPTDVDLLAEIATLLHARIGQMPVRIGGVMRAGDVLREVNSSTKSSVMRTLDLNHEAVAGALRQSLFAFKDIATLDTQTLKVVLHETDQCHWAVALKGTPISLQHRVFQSLAPQMAELLKGEMNAVGPLRLSEISGVQTQIANEVLRLDSENLIELPSRKSKREQGFVQYRLE